MIVLHLHSPNNQETTLFDSSEITHWNEYFKLFVGLLAIIDPLTIIPAFLSLTTGHSAVEKRRIAGIASVTVFITLLVFTFFGTAILELFAISLPAFRIAGGILLLLLALDMMRSSDDSGAEIAPGPVKSAMSVAIIPLAIPLMAGPGAISTVIIYASIHESFSHQLMVAFVVLSVAAVSMVVLRLSTRAEKFLSKTGLMVFNHIMGLIIAAVAVEFILGGVGSYFPGLAVAQQ